MKLRRYAAIGMSLVLSFTALSAPASALDTASDSNGDGVIDVFDYILEKRSVVAESKPLTLSVANASGVPGETVWTALSVKNNTGLSDISFTFSYDTALSPLRDAFQEMDSLPSKLGEQFGIKLTEDAQKGRITCVSTVNTETKEDGEIVRIGFTIPKDAQVGTQYVVNFRSCGCRDTDNHLLESKLLEHGVITVTEPTKAEQIRTPLARGVDISHWQQEVDYQKVRAAGMDFVILRAGCGDTVKNLDPMFYQNYEQAKAAGLSVGVYWHTFAMNAKEAAHEAEVVMEILGDRQFEYPVCFDIEEKSQMNLTPAQFSEVVATFCNVMKEHGYYAIVYGSACPLNDHFTKEAQQQIDVWVAHYKTDKPIYKGEYKMWQYSCTGRVDGINCNVDLDYSYFNYESFIKKNHWNRF